MRPVREITRQIVEKKAIALASEFSWELKPYSNDMWYYNNLNCLHRSKLITKFCDIGFLFTMVHSYCGNIEPIPISLGIYPMTNTLLDILLNHFNIKVEEN